MSQDEIALIFLSLGILLATGRLFGELAQRFGQPTVVGELLAGVLLGPTLMGRIWPEFTLTLFPVSGLRADVLEGLTTVSVALFLMAAGIEVRLSTIWRRGKTSLSVAVAGFAFPFALAFAAAWFFPFNLGCEVDANPRIFALFFAAAISISALPVIARTLMDLDLYRSDLGMIVIAAAVFNDLLGWMVFAITLGLLGGGANPFFSASATILFTLLSAAVMLTVGRWLLHRVLPWIQAHATWPGGVMGFAVSLALLAAALTEWIGIHAIFGAFLVGVAIGDSSHLRPQTRHTIHDFVSFVFAPLFFASVGLRVDFAAKFIPSIVATVLLIACVGKILGCGLAGRLAGMDWRASWAVGFAMNARGAMEIILGLLALNSGLIRQRMLVALVAMAVVTSLMAGPAIQRLLRRPRHLRFTRFISPRGFYPRLRAANRWDAMERLARVLLPAEEADSTLWGGDVRVEWAGPNQEVAVCLVGLSTVRAPRVAVGIADQGIDFGPLAETKPKLVLLILTCADEPEHEVALEEDVVRSFESDSQLHPALMAQTLTEFLAAVRMGDTAPADDSLAFRPVG
jgi:Kef-type K+ transport system membrane component KefB